MGNFKKYFLAVIKSLIRLKFVDLPSQIILSILCTVIITLYYEVLTFLVSVL